MSQTPSPFGSPQENIGETGLPTNESKFEESDSVRKAILNPLQTPLLMLGNCTVDDSALYEAYYDSTYRKGPFHDKHGRRVIFPSGLAEHICTSKSKWSSRTDSSRDWREDRAKRLPWIGVAFTHASSMIKENKEPGRWSYLIRMMKNEGAGLSQDYYQVVAEPRRQGLDVELVTAYSLTLIQWSEAVKRKSVPRPPGAKKSESGRY